MLHINKIIIKNFRPYFGIQSFAFGREEGLSIILGDNGIGKTSLIKAIKFVLYNELDSVGTFKIKNEMNIIAWEQQTYEFFVALDFLYNNEQYVLKRVVRVKSGLNEPTSDLDFENTVTLIKNEIMLSKDETNKILKNIIPKEISEYILFEGETISKYKNLLDNNKNQEIYDSIRKILGIKVLENSKIDLENQLDKYNGEKLQKIKENNKNLNLQKELEKNIEKQKAIEKNKNDLEEKLKDINEKINEYKQTLENNQRIHKIIDKKRILENDLNLIEQDIKNQIESIKKILKQYKTFCYDVINYQISNISDDVENIKKVDEKNKIIDNEIKISKEVINSSQCKYCGHEINHINTQKIKEKINLMESEKTTISDEDLIKLNKYNSKVETLRVIISSIKKEDFKKDIINIESEIQEKLIKKQNCKENIKSINDQIDNLDTVDNIEKALSNWSINLKNKGICEEQIAKDEETIKEIKKIIDNLMKKEHGIVDFSIIDNKIEKTKILINIFSKSISEYSENMRKKVQKDATDMFKKISENSEYDCLEFDQHYGLKLFDIYNRPVPNISTGYMTLITISLIYGLHNNSSLTGTIILDAPFSVLTNFHRNKIINAFLSLSPQVLLFVYKDQIDLESIRNIMKDKLINEYEIYQNKEEQNFIYKTNIRGTE